MNGERFDAGSRRPGTGEQRLRRNGGNERITANGARSVKNPSLSPDLVCAFTLLELLVVFAVLAVLAGLTLVAVNRGLQSARATACASNLRQLGVALSGYLAEHDQRMPVLKAGRLSREEEVAVVDNTIDRYISARAVFACPADHQYAAASGTSYFWNVALNGQALASLNFFQLSNQHGQIPVLADKAGFHPYIENKVNILYADGHASKDVSFITGN